MYCRLLIILIFKILSISTYAQVLEISGYVRDINNYPIVSSSISLLKVTDSLTVDFTRTDQQGNFTLKYSGQLPVIISIKKMGYQTEYRTLVEKNKLILTFSLRKDTVLHIEEVIVNRKPKIGVKGDTTNYHLDAFRLGGERNLEEALARLPGFEIQEDGKISVNGRPIQKILIEGDDLVSGQYTLLSKNLSPDLIDDVQLIDNFLDDPFFKTSSRSVDIALNLRFKEKFKSTFLTNAMLELGTTDRYNANLNNILLSRKTKLYVLTSMNNIGNDLSRIRMETVSRTSMVSSYRPEVNLETLTDIGTGIVPRLDKRRWFDNKSSLLSVNVNQPVTKKLSMKLNSGIGYTKSRRRKFMSSKYILPGDSVLTFMENHDWKSNELNSSNDLQVNYLLTPNKRIRYELKTDFSNESGLNNVLFNQIPIKQSLKVKGLNISNSLNYVNRFKNRSFLSLDLFYRSYLLPQNYDVQGYNYSSLFSEQNNDTLLQEVRTTGDFLGARATYYFTIKGFQIVGRTGLESSENDLLSKLLPSKDSPIWGRELNNNLIYRTDRKYFEVEMERNLFGKVDIRAMMNLSEFDLSLQSPLTTKNSNRLFFLPDVKLTYSPSRKEKLVLGLKRSITFPSVMYLYEHPILSSYRYANRYTDSLFFRSNDNLSLGYRFNDPFSQLSFNATAYYSITANSFISNNEISDEFNISRKILGTDNKNLGFIYGASKFIPTISTTAKFSGSSFNFHSQNQINGSGIRKINSWSFDNNISFISSYGGLFNYIVSVQKNIVRNKIGLENILSENKTSFLKVQLTTDLRLGAGIYLQAMASRYQWKNNGKLQRPFLGVDGSIRKSIFKDKVTLNLTAWNILDSQNLSFNQISDFYTNEISYNLLRRMVLIGAKFSL
ncbi:hypothetical protein BN1088_1431274 [Sphingobacterium sp. PM2-P1-29]|nr:hypothetical protein BN1088_1431274 [Sphingobacterium sp. PM2-P1-29]